MKTPSLRGKDIEEKRQEIREYFIFCYKRYEALFDVVANEEAYFQKSDPLRHPIVFYYGHTAVFFVNKLKLLGLWDKRINPRLEALFAVGVDEMSWDDLNEKHYDWASVKETQVYRDKVFKKVLGLIDSLELSLPITKESPWWVILMGIEHENIHLETTSVLIRQIPIQNIREDKNLILPPQKTKEYPQNTMLNISGDRVSLGKEIEDDFFAWDNEYGKHKAVIAPFKASKYLVSNGEFKEFVEADGYACDSYWDKEGLAWREYTHATAPLFWIIKDNEYRLRTISKEIDLPLDWAVEVNHLEAMAFCRYKSQKEGTTFTLPTEDEYQRLYDISDIKEANIDLKFKTSSPVDMFCHGEFYDVVGNVWQWSKTAIYPFEGFKVHPIYDDFSVPTFDRKHALVKGGSFMSCGNEALAHSRYAFRKHFYQHAGFRYMQSTYEEETETDIYNTDALISQYCHFGWGEIPLAKHYNIENYPKACADIILDYMKDKPRKVALDIGCAIGRSSFELAKGFDKVIGVDFSARFIQEALRLKEKNSLRYVMTREGDLDDYHEISLDKFGLLPFNNKVEFAQADACNLKPLYQNLDLIFAGNLIDRLYEPQQFLEDISHRLNDKGILVLTSPYTWQEESTPKDKWIGGYKKEGENVSTLEGLQSILKEFRLIRTQDVPFIIQETHRKHQFTMAQMSIWEKL